MRSAKGYCAILALFLTAAVPPLAGRIASIVGLEGAPAELAADYIATLYLCTLPLAFAPITDHIFIGLGNTRIPMALQATAVAFYQDHLWTQDAPLLSPTCSA